MEHQVNVPCPVDDVTRVLADPDRLRRCVPGLQTDAADGAGGGPADKLRLRVGNTTITYRGTLRVEPAGSGTGAGSAFRVEAEGEEARGDGGVRVALDVVAEAADDGGTVLRVSGSVKARGRLADADPRTADAAGRRLLDRFGADLAEEAARAAGGSGAEEGLPSAEDPSTGGEESAETADRTSSRGRRPDQGPDTTSAPAPRRDEDGAEADGDAAQDGGAAETAGDGRGDRDEDAPVPGGAVPDDAAPDDPALADELPADDLPDDPSADEPVVGNARRTMIGRSTEEVDHAPPRGRYAPVAVPETVRAADTLRWAAPAAAALLASAVVVGRVLRRRR